jgi:hypothetical protein
MFYTNLNKDKGKYIQSLYKSEEELGAEALQKAEETDIIIKGRKAEPIGTRKHWGNTEYVKTAQGWKADKKTIAAHDKIHGTQKEEGSKSFDYNRLLTPAVISGIKGSVEAAKADGNDSVNIDSDRIISLFTDKLSPEEYKNFDQDKAENVLLDYAGKLLQTENKENDHYNKLAENSKPITPSKPDPSNPSSEMKQHGEELKTGDHVVVNPNHPSVEFHAKVVEPYGTNGVKIDRGDGRHSVYPRSDVKSKQKHESDNLAKLTPNEHGSEAAKHFDQAQKEYFKGNHDKSNEHHEKGHEHLMHALGKQKDKFNAVYNNSEVKPITVGGSHKPLSSQLQVITGDHYNAQDFDGDASTGSIITHKKTGQKFTVVNHKQADLVKHYQDKNKEAVKTFNADKIAKVLKEQTANNNHTESLYHLAHELGNEDAKEKLLSIQREHNKLGHLPYNLQGDRHEIYKNLLNEVKEKHGEAAHKKIHSSL